MTKKKTQKKALDTLLGIHNTISTIGTIYAGLYEGFSQIAKQHGGDEEGAEEYKEFSESVFNQKMYYLGVVQKGIFHMCDGDESLIVGRRVPLSAILPEVDWMEAKIEILLYKEEDEKDDSGVLIYYELIRPLLEYIKKGQAEVNRMAANEEPEP